MAVESEDAGCWEGREKDCVAGQGFESAPDHLDSVQRKDSYEDSVSGPIPREAQGGSVRCLRTQREFKAQFSSTPSCALLPTPAASPQRIMSAKQESSLISEGRSLLL